MSIICSLRIGDSQPDLVRYLNSDIDKTVKLVWDEYNAIG